MSLSRLRPAIRSASAPRTATLPPLRIQTTPCSIGDAVTPRSHMVATSARAALARIETQEIIDQLLDLPIAIKAAEIDIERGTSPRFRRVERLSFATQGTMSSRTDTGLIQYP